jgi:hypothetical protein
MKTRNRFTSVLVLLLGLSLRATSRAGSAETPPVSTLSEMERVTSAGTSLLTFLKSYATALKSRDLDAMLALHDDNYASQGEGLWIERLQSDRDGVRVYGWEIDHPRAFGKSDLRDQAADLLRRVDPIEQANFKLTALERLDEEGNAVIRAVLWLRGKCGGQGSYESQATFRIWLRADGQDWKLARKELLSGWTVQGPAEGFTNVTEAAGIQFEAHHNPLWAKPEWAPKQYGIVKYAGAGVAAVDYDGDGWCDIFFGDEASPRLYRNKGDATFEDVTQRVGLPTDVPGISVAIFADLDNDGDKDLFLGQRTGASFLFRNDGSSFVDVSEQANVRGRPWVSTAAVADYNNDGLLDIYIARYLDARDRLPSLLFYTRNGERNSLLRNDGNLHFTDVAVQAGVSDSRADQKGKLTNPFGSDDRDSGLGLGVGWGDYDADGDQDLYVANDFGRNALFQNNGDGTFRDVAQQSGTLDIRFSMSATFADIDNDLDLDLYVSNIHSGQRWYGHRAVLENYVWESGKRLADVPLLLEVYAAIGGKWETFGEHINRGNSLYLNRGGGRFADISDTARVTPYGWYWGSTIFDFDNDGLQDIYAVNGWVTGKKKDDL